MEENLLGIAQHLFIRVEKRGLPLEASKALVNLIRGRGSKDIALSMLERAKKHLPFWIEDDSQVQVYKRYFNYLSKKEGLLLAEGFSPFVLINCWESFEGIVGEGNAFERLKGFFLDLRVEELLDTAEPSDLLETLTSRCEAIKGQGFYIATHVAFMLNPHAFLPVTPRMGSVLGIKKVEPYLRLTGSLRERRIKPIEALSLFHMLYENVPPKRRYLEDMLGIDRELELLEEAKALWNSGRFYEAHEVLEEVWKITADPKRKECYQGVIRLAIALHHYKNGETERAVRVLEKAALQLQACNQNLRLNVRDLSLFASEMLRRLRSGEGPGEYPTLRVV